MMETAPCSGEWLAMLVCFPPPEDLAVVFQMLLNGGTYGGSAFRNPGPLSTSPAPGMATPRPGLISLMIKPSKAENSRNKLAKPPLDIPASREPAPGQTLKTLSSYIFSPIRIYPYQNRKIFVKWVRPERIHQVIYDALDTCMCRKCRRYEDMKE